MYSYFKAFKIFKLNKNTTIILFSFTIIFNNIFKLQFNYIYINHQILRKMKHKLAKSGSEK